jgi:hypothetical protein
VAPPPRASKHADDPGTISGTVSIECQHNGRRHHIYSSTSFVDNVKIGSTSSPASVSWDLRQPGRRWRFADSQGDRRRRRRERPSGGGPVQQPRRHTKLFQNLDHRAGGQRSPSRTVAVTATKSRAAPPTSVKTAPPASRHRHRHQRAHYTLQFKGFDQRPQQRAHDLTAHVRDAD